MRTRIERLWPLLALALIAAIVLLSFPYLASAYYLEAGGRAMQTDALAGKASRSAIAHLNRSIAWDSTNAQAYRLLAQAHRSTGDWSAAMEALTRYIELRPEHALGYVELAGLYQARETWTETAHQEAIDLAQRIREAWHSGGQTQASSIEMAKEAQAAGRTEKALVWLWRGVALQPQVGDAWHELGLWYQERELWLEAVNAFEEALETGHFDQVSASEPAYYAGLIYQSRLDPRKPGRALELYNTALTLNQFSTPGMLADCHYRRGDILRIEGRKVDEYIAAFEAAVAANPQHAWAHARLGQAYYRRDGDAAAAEAELKRAIALTADNKWMYVILGDVYRLEGRTEEARAEYEQAVEIDPEFVEAHARLRSLDTSP